MVNSLQAQLAMHFSELFLKHISSAIDYGITLIPGQYILCELVATLTKELHGKSVVHVNPHGVTAL